MNIDEMLKKMEEKYTEIKDMEFDSTTNYCTPQGYGYIKGFGYAVELIKSYQEMNLTEKLDEPEKPVIPQFVADWIESYRKKTLVELINDSVYSSDEDSKCFRRWFHEEMGFESNYSEFLARAWLDGYYVDEEEKGIYMEIQIVRADGIWEIQFTANKSTNFIVLNREQMEDLYNMIGDELYSEEQGERTVNEKS